MNNKYKEIIFLNETELYSALAQLNKGYIDSLTDKSSNTNKNGELDTSTGTAGVESGIPVSKHLPIDETQMQPLNDDSPIKKGDVVIVINSQK